jgi:hypothetical protein
MKTARFFFMSVGLSALTLGLGYAGEPFPQSSASAAHEEHITGNRPAENNLQQPMLKRATTAANTTALAPGIVRGRSATAASIGGLTTSSAKNSAATINGTAMNRKRY